MGDPPPGPTPHPVEPPLDDKPVLKSKTGHGRATLPADLRRETVVVDIPEAEKLAVGDTVGTPAGCTAMPATDVTIAAHFATLLAYPSRRPITSPDCCPRKNADSTSKCCPRIQTRSNRHNAP